MSGLMSSLSSNMEKKQMEGHFIFSDNNECLEFIIDRILYCTINYLMHMSSSSTELLRVSCEGMHGWQTFVLRLTSIYSLFSSCDLGMLSSTVSLASPKSSSKPVLVYIVLRFFWYFWYLSIIPKGMKRATYIYSWELWIFFLIQFSLIDFY